MRAQDGAIGDFSQEFSLSVFFPTRLRQPVNLVSDFSFAVFNMCGFVNCVRRYLEGKPTVQATQPKEEFKEVKTIEKKKAALEFLDEEIQ